MSEYTRAGELEGAELRQRMARLIGGYQLSAAIGAVPGFRLAHGCGLWEYLAREPDAAAMFNESMSRVAAANTAAIVRTYDFSHVNRLVDVGGGHGVLACAVPDANPHMHGVVRQLYTVPAHALGAGDELDLLALGRCGRGEPARLELCASLAGRSIRGDCVVIADGISKSPPELASAKFRTQCERMQAA